MKLKHFAILFFVSVSFATPHKYRYVESEYLEDMLDDHMHPDHDSHTGKLFSSSRSAKMNEDEKTSEYWLNQAKDHLEMKLKEIHNTGKAKNVILFIGDGMSHPTITAARIQMGDESMKLSFEDLPHTASIKTYCVDVQVSDSACTATAFLSGVKTNDALIGLNGRAIRKSCEDGNDDSKKVESFATWAMNAGKDAGFVTTTRVTHATPSAMYAHITDRDWENNIDLEIAGCDSDLLDDIGEQLVHNEAAQRLKVMMGGGSMNLIDRSFSEHGSFGNRTDGKNLIDEWRAMDPSRTFVNNRRELMDLKPEDVKKLLGVFNGGHIEYNLDIQEENQQEIYPSLTDMTLKAIDILNENENGYFLFVEGGRIDHAHHQNQARYAVDETIEFSKAVEATLAKVNLEDTLVVVSADHGHVMTIAGYADRGNDIFGVAGIGDDDVPYMTLSYANGLGYTQHFKDGKRVDVNTMSEQWKQNNFRFPSTLPVNFESHGGEDVGLWAIGPWSHLFQGTMEQHVIPHIMGYASCVGNGMTMCDEECLIKTFMSFVIITICWLSTVHTIDEYHHKRILNNAPRTFSFKDEKERQPEYWMEHGQLFLKELLNRQENTNKAKNVIFFLGDGMSFATIAATRVYMGGEEIELSFEKFPYTGFSKTYCIDAQVADSGCTATAYLSGVKTNYEVIGLNGRATPRNCTAHTDEESYVDSIVRWAQKSCKSTGIVTNTRITHASPSVTYAHMGHREWESDINMERDNCDSKEHMDIAEQLVYNIEGRNLKVILGGGRENFRNETELDEENQIGNRRDGRNLIEEWKTERNKDGVATYVYDKNGLRNVDISKTDYLLGLFEHGHMRYNLDVINRNLEHQEPTLTDMTSTAIKMLQKEENGYFLFVEGGMIDQAHHDGYSRLSLDETKEFSRAVDVARHMTDTSDTLIVVTSDHSHVFTYNGYPPRGNDVFGMADISDVDDIPFMTLSYANGPGFEITHDEEGNRINPETYDTTDPFFQYPSLVLRERDTHGGEDVGVWASGPMAHLFKGHYEQSEIPVIMARILEVGPYAVDEKCAACMVKVNSSTMKVFLFVLLVVSTCSGKDEIHSKAVASAPPVINVMEGSSEFWRNKAQHFITMKLDSKINMNKAKNVILFLGDGMSFSSVAATRMYLGGEETELSFEKFPHFGMAKTYCVNAQVGDSACTATAFLSGVKTNYNSIGVNANVVTRQCLIYKEDHVDSIFNWAQKSNMATGIVTSTRVTHATPAAAYSHVPHRDWEHNAAITSACREYENVTDIAHQLIHDEVGKNVKVILGCGRRSFINTTTVDEEGRPGLRSDARNLIDEWLEERNKNGKAKYVGHRQELNEVDSDNTDYLLGLFEDTHCRYQIDVDNNGLQYQEPSLSDMTAKAISMLQKHKEGFLLLVEGGRIDHAHHDNKPHLALGETAEFSKAIDIARHMTNEEDTLIVVTSDHSHPMAYNGYPQRGKDILGIAGISDVDFLPYETLTYGNGPGYQTVLSDSVSRIDLTTIDMKNPQRQASSNVPRSSSTHTGEDVGIYSSGPWSHLFAGNYEQNNIPILLAYASKIGPYQELTRTSTANRLSISIILITFVVLLKYLYTF
ncbi:CLUMA_CG015026, isoform A [Clunio marinus]|uniref:Alkaline phosphatase n=1 Tax=Clunio marinus TaxID=568069 RepID=A0A1J1IQ07_9DIPT|nr:CLUMA_CG015026, isoform A [Clunio marinus]